MDEAPGVADRELILSGMLVCSTARPARTLQRIIDEKRLVVPSQIFRMGRAFLARKQIGGKGLIANRTALKFVRSSWRD